MGQVTVTYNAWDHNRQPIPAIQVPEIWFRPVATSYASGLMTDREVKGTLNADGSGEVHLETGVWYVPFMRWLVPGQTNTPNAARGYAEWKAFVAWKSGAIGEQPTSGGDPSGLWWVSLNPPPSDFRGMWLVSDPTVTPQDMNPVIGELRRVY